MNLINDETTDNEYYLLTIEYKLDNPDLQKMLSEKKVQFVCELSCTGTLYRKSETSDSLIQKISVSKNYVRDKVELLFVLVSVESNSNYTNSKVHNDYAGYNFDIDNGDVLAYLGESFFIAGIAYQRLKAVSSFMEIIKGENETGDFNIILESQKIQIQLSKKDYEQYCEPRIGKNPEYATVFHSSIVLPTLIHALYQLKNDDDVKEYSWAKIIEFRLQNDENLKTIEFEEKTFRKLHNYFLECLLKGCFKIYLIVKQQILITKIKSNNMELQKVFREAYIENLRRGVKNGSLVKYYESDTFLFDSEKIMQSPRIMKPTSGEFIIPDETSFYDFENSKIIYEAYKTLTPLQASDVRLWTPTLHIQITTP